MPSNATWRDTRIGTVFVSVTGIRGTVIEIVPPIVTARMDDGSVVDVQVRLDDPVEIVVPSGQGERNVVGILGAVALTEWLSA